MQSTSTVEELMGSIQYLDYRKHKQVKEVLNELIKRKEETIPYLLRLLENTVERTEDFIGNEREDYINAILLLAQWKINEAFPILLSSIEVSEFRQESFYDEFLIDNLDRILASLINPQQVEVLYALIENEKVDSFVRSSGIRAIGVLCKEGTLSRESVQAYFQQLLQGDLLDDSGEVYGSLVCMCMDLLFEDLLEDIKGAYEAERIDESYVVLAGAENHFAVAEGYIDESLVFITDIHEELSMEKHRISEEGRKFLERKLGLEKKVKKVETFIKKDVTERNAPCPCGSGKKYKKCCGK